MRSAMGPRTPHQTKATPMPKRKQTLRPHGRLRHSKPTPRPAAATHSIPSGRRRSSVAAPTRCARARHSRRAAASARCKARRCYDCRACPGLKCASSSVAIVIPKGRQHLDEQWRRPTITLASSHAAAGLCFDRRQRGWICVSRKVATDPVRCGHRTRHAGALIRRARAGRPHRRTR